jgi:anti-sigma factor RsiW
MPADLHVLDDLPAYALGSLEEGEARQVAEHLAGCHTCRAELARYQEVADELVWAAPAASPPADLKPRLLERVRSLPVYRTQAVEARGGWPVTAPRDSLAGQGEVSERPAPGREYADRPERFSPGRLLRVGAIAGVALLFLALGSLLLRQITRNTAVLTGPLGMRAIALQNTGAAPGASGIVVVGPDGDNGVIVVDDLPPLDAAHEYQVWLTRDGETIPGPFFPVDESGYRGMRIEAPESLLTYAGVIVTVEPAGGSPEPTGEQVLTGSLFNP